MNTILLLVMLIVPGGPAENDWVKGEYLYKQYEFASREDCARFRTELATKTQGLMLLSDCGTANSPTSFSAYGAGKREQL